MRKKINKYPKIKQQNNGVIIIDRIKGISLSIYHRSKSIEKCNTEHTTQTRERTNDGLSKTKLVWASCIKMKQPVCLSVGFFLLFYV